MTQHILFPALRSPASLTPAIGQAHTTGKALILGMQIIGLGDEMVLLATQHENLSLIPQEPHTHTKKSRYEGIQVSPQHWASGDRRFPA